MRRDIVCIALMVFALVALGAGTTVWAQDEEAKLDVDFNGESLSQVLQMLKRGYDLEYVLGEGVDPEMRINTSLRGVTLDEALKIITGANGLIAVNQNGRYQISKRAVPKARPDARVELLPSLGGVRTPPPSPTRPVTASATAAVAPDADADKEDEDEEEEQILDIIWPRYLGADLASMIFDGDVMENEGYYGSGDSNGGYGNNNNNSSGGYGNNNSNRGNSSYGNSSYGNSNRGSSNRSSNRSSSRSNYY